MVLYLAKLINFYSRFIGYILSFIVTIFLIGIISLEGVSVAAITSSSFLLAINIGWGVLLGNSLLLSINAIFVSLSFDNEVKKLKEEGKPIESAEGFRNLERRYKMSNFFIFVILFLAILSWLFFYFAIKIKEEFARFFNYIISEEKLASLNLYLTLSFLFFTIAAALIFRIPSIADLRIGTLLKYYKPSRHKYVLNSYFHDAVFTLLDPITRIYFLKWSEKSVKELNEDFAPKIDFLIERKNLAVQNILILFYLHHRFPSLINFDILRSEIKRIIPEERIDNLFYKYEFNLETWKKIFSILLKKNRDLFLIIDRIIFTLKETPYVMNAKKYWFTSAVPPTQKKEESQDIIFFVWNRNKNPDYSPFISLSFVGADDLSPHDFEMSFKIRKYDDFILIPEDYDFDEKPDLRFLVKLVTGIIYQGTSIWFSVHSENIGSNMIAIEFREKEEPLETQMFNMRVVIDFKTILQVWGPRLLASFGVLLPLVKAILGL
ncbi:MAG: hypothetical protein K9W46_00485 [Candidatus Heimdallarchaeum endolithica]|uniref:Uncharacterized protein n=1 Tax=Candidatus Heimdallarchaeum endolithica TaxID=2876572 RepID=A0A9Y1FNQ2_9ARCH|nr:MAG: hypothetical protein K9W46_00485 [Candidatus Heimdallarchaeum endolithica]